MQQLNSQTRNHRESVFKKCIGDVFGKRTLWGKKVLLIVDNAVWFCADTQCFCLGGMGKMIAKGTTQRDKQDPLPRQLLMTTSISVAFSLSPFSAFSITFRLQMKK